MPAHRARALLIFPSTLRDVASMDRLRILPEAPPSHPKSVLDAVVPMHSENWGASTPSMTIAKDFWHFESVVAYCETWSAGRLLAFRPQCCFTAPRRAWRNRRGQGEHQGRDSGCRFAFRCACRGMERARCRQSLRGARIPVSNAHYEMCIQVDRLAADLPAHAARRRTCWRHAVVPEIT